MGISEDTFIDVNITDREQAIEDLAFLSDQRNDKSIKYAIECIDKLEKIEKIVEEWNNDTEKDIESFDTMERIKEVLEKE